jgi:hypothetical protein
MKIWLRAGLFLFEPGCREVFFLIESGGAAWLDTRPFLTQGKTKTACGGALIIPKAGQKAPVA